MPEVLLPGHTQAKLLGLHLLAHPPDAVRGLRGSVLARSRARRPGRNGVFSQVLVHDAFVGTIGNNLSLLRYPAPYSSTSRIVTSRPSFSDRFPASSTAINSTSCSIGYGSTPLRRYSRKASSR